MPKVEIYLDNEMLKQIKLKQESDVSELRQELNDFIQDKDYLFIDKDGNKVPLSEENTMQSIDLVNLEYNAIYLVNTYEDKEDSKSFDSKQLSLEQTFNETNPQSFKMSSASPKINKCSDADNHNESNDQNSEKHNLNFFHLEQPTENQEQIELRNAPFSFTQYDKRAQQQQDINDIYEEAMDMPPCFERCLQLLYYYFSSKNVESSNNTNKFNQPDLTQIDNLIETEIVNLKNKLESEEAWDESVHKNVRKLLEEVDKSNWQKATIFTKALLLKIKPFNIYQFKKYNSKNNVTDDYIKDKNIIFVIGKAGEGKSTTLHVLGGSRMERIDVQGMEHIGVTQVYNKMLYKVTTSPYSVSETRCLIPVDIEFNNKKYTFVDSPGRDDTRGSEIDVANSISITNGICNSKTVRLLVFQSSLNIGDRFQGIKDLANFMIQMIPNISQMLSSVTYIFTKFPAGSQKSIMAKLKDVLNNMTENQKNDKSFVCFIRDLVQKAQDNKIIYLDPLNDNPQEILKKILSSDKIKYPYKYFHQSIFTRSQTQLNDQVKLLEKQILKAIQRYNKSFIEHKLEQLIYLAQQIQQDKIKSTLNECLKQLQQMLNKNYTDGIKNFSKSFNNNILLKEDIIDYCKRIEQQEVFANLAKDFLNQNIPMKEDFLLNIDILIEPISKEIAQKDIKDQYIIQALIKVQLISQYIESYKVNFASICSQVQAKICQIVENYNEALSKNEFNIVVQELNSYQESTILYHDFFKSEQMNTRHEQMQDALIQHLNTIHNKFLSILQQDNLSKNEGQNLQQLLKILTKAQNKCQKLSTEVHEKVCVIYENTINKFKQKFTQLVQQQKQDINNDFKASGQIFEKIDILYNVQGIKNALSDEYYDTLSHIKAILQEYARDIENRFIKQDGSQQSQQEYMKISQMLNKLENANWIKKYDNDIFNYITESITEKITGNIIFLISDLQRLKININYTQDFLKATQKVQQLKDIRILEINIPEVKTVINEAMTSFENQLNKIIDGINCTISIDQDKNYIPFERKYKKIQDQWVFLDESSNNQCNRFFEVYNLKEKVENYLIYQKQQCLKQWNQSLSQLKQFYDLKQDFQKVFDLACIIVNSMDEQKNMKERYEQLYKIYTNNDQEILETQIKQMSSHYDELQDMISQNKYQSSFEKMLINLEIVKSLRQIDSFMPPNKQFSTLYQENIQVLYKDMSQQEQDIIQAIENQDFDMVQKQLWNISQATQRTSKYEQIRIKLNKNIKEFIITTKDAIKQLRLKEKVTKENIDNLAKQLRKISEAENLDYYLDKKNSIKENKNVFKDTISRNLIQYMNDNVQKLIDSESFDLAQEELNFMEYNVETLELYCSKQVESEILKFNQQISSWKKNLVDSIVNMPIKQYSDLNPKQICEKLSQNKTGSNKKIIDQIEEHTEVNLKIELNKIAKIRIKNQLDYQLKQLSTLLCFVPKKVQDKIQKHIDQVKDDLSEWITDRKNQLNSALTSDNFDVIKQILLQAAQDKDYLITQQIDDTCFKKIDQIKQNIEQKPNYDFDQQLKNNIIKINKYKIFFESLTEQLKALEVINLIQANLQHKLDSNLTIFKMKLDPTMYSNSFPNINRSYTFDSFKQSYNWLIQVLLFKIDQSTCYKSIMSKFDEIIKMKFIYLNKMIKDIQDQYQNIINQDNTDTEQLANILQIAKQQDTYIMFLKSQEEQLLQTQDDSLLALVNILKEAKCYNDMQQKVISKFESITQNCHKLCEELLHVQVYIYECDRKTQFKKINNLFQYIGKWSCLEQHLQNGTDINNLLQKASDILSTNVIRAENTLLVTLKNQLFEKTSIQIFNNLYNNIVTLYDCVQPSYLITNVKQNIVNQFVAKLNDIKNQIGQDSNVEQTCETLIKLQTIANGVIAFKTECTYIIKTMINKQKQYHGRMIISQLGRNLCKDPIGKMVVSEFKDFEGYQKSLFSQKFQQIKIEHLIEKTKGTDLDKELLIKTYNEFDNIYKNLIDKFLNRDKCTKDLIIKLKELIGSDNLKLPDYALPFKIIQDFPKILAYLAAIWTIQNSDYYYEAEKDSNYLLIPHAGQIISLLRLVGSGNKVEQLQNNLVQVNTGEGKSLILAFSSAFLALVGYDVSCVCYSKYLSRRDCEEFSTFFEELGVVQSIHYNIFDVTCENIINEQGNIRQNIESIITDNLSKIIKVEKHIKPKILLVDEADVFFSKDFYGKMYNPGAQLKSDNILNLMQLIWENRDENVTLNKIQTHDIYQKILNEYMQWQTLLDNQIQQMIYDVKQFIKEPNMYTLQLLKEGGKEIGRIGYKEQDSISFDYMYGYKTIFAYFQEYDKKQISFQCLQDNASLLINCGQFSYAEIPYQFAYILGVTGTLDSLSTSEKEVIENDYKIDKYTFVPSVYGPNNLLFNDKNDIKVVSSEHFFITLEREIQDRLKGKISGTNRSVLVFFEDKPNLTSFYESEVFEQFKKYTQCLTEESTDDEKESIIKNSTLEGQITLLIKCFARGTDFIPRDDIVSTNGGVHVIQTFISESYSEEIQTRGRTARQGQHGSFSLIILDSSLEKYQITQKDIDYNKGRLYEFINDKRNIYFNDQYKTTKKFIADAKLLHDETIQLLENIKVKNIPEIKDFILKNNIFVQQKTISKTLVIMDGTGSMDGLILKAKTTVEKMFDRACQILLDNKIQEGCFELQFAIYRSYNEDEDDILQASGWEITPQNLRKFTETIKATGGYGEESVEIGLQYANMQHAVEPISQVILIGDAPPTPPDQVFQRRNKRPYYWQKTKFKECTDYIKESNTLKANEIKVHTYYVQSWAQQSFEEIANITGGQSKLLDINSEAGADDLTSIVTKAVLQDVGKNTGKGDTYMLQYDRKFAKGISS